jgi:ribosomal protein S27E
VPSNHYCASCKVGFAVGWYHYHEERDGFGAETLLVCSGCGTMHSVAHPSPVRIPILGGLFHRPGRPEKTERLMAQSGPCFLGSAEQDVMEHLKAWVECRVAHALRPPSKHSYMKDFLELAPVKCHHCDRSSTLVRDWGYQNVRCPACGEPKVSVTQQWMT